MLVDTSASQMGQFRRLSQDALEGMIEAARPADRLLLAAADVTCTPLTQGFSTHCAVKHCRTSGETLTESIFGRGFDGNVVLPANYGNF